MGDCESPSSRSWWMEGECQRLMCLMTWRDIDIDIAIMSTFLIISDSFNTIRAINHDRNARYLPDIL